MHRIALVLASFLVLAGSGRADAATVVVKPGKGTLQAALDAAQDGTVIVLRAGVYRGAFVRSDVRNLTLRAQGRVILDGRPARPGGTTIDTLLTFTRVDGLTIEGIMLRNPSNDGIFLTDCSSFVVRRCTFENCRDSGVEDRNTTGYRVDRCTFRVCSYGLATGYDSSASGVSITNSQFSRSFNYAIDLWASGATVRGNTISGGRAKGINLQPGFSGVTVRNNRISNTGGTAIVADGSSHTISSNTVTGVRAGGIAVVGASGGNTIAQNVVTRARGDGFSVASAGNTFTQNKAVRSGGVGLRSEVPKASNAFDRNAFGTVVYAP